MRQKTVSAADRVKELAYSVADFARQAGISRTTVYAEIAAGRLRARKLGTRTIITDDDGRAFLASLPTIQSKDASAA